MAIGKCRECGKEASSEAKACPHCGASSPVSTGNSLLKFAIVFVGVVVVVNLALESEKPAASTNRPSAAAPETDEQRDARLQREADLRAEKARKEYAFQKTVAAANALKRSLRDPASLVWESIRTNEEATVICLEYRARNGFGGMNKEFVVIADGNTSQKAAAWNKHCTRQLQDMKYVQYALK